MKIFFPALFGLCFFLLIVPTVFLLCIIGQIASLFGCNFFERMMTDTDGQGEK